MKKTPAIQNPTHWETYLPLVNKYASLWELAKAAGVTYNSLYATQKRYAAGEGGTKMRAGTYQPLIDLAAKEGITLG